MATLRNSFKVEAEGGCLCGALRYRIGGPVGPAVHCHCAMCRRSGGGAVATWISVARDRFAFTKGEPQVYRSSAQAERRFCPRCGAQLTFWSERHPDITDVTTSGMTSIFNSRRNTSPPTSVIVSRVPAIPPTGTR